MSFTSPKSFLLDGQEVTYVEDKKTLLFTIHEPFFKAGQILGWPTEFGSVGLGINHAIFEFIKRAKCKLIIHIESESYDCIVHHDFLKKFIRDHNNEYKAGGKKFVHVFPLRLCNGYHPHKEIIS